MNFGRLLPVMAFVVLSALSFRVHAIQSYSEWKSGRVQGAQIKVTSLKVQIESKKVEKMMKRDVAQGKDPNMALSKAATEARIVDVQIEKMEKILQQDLYDLDLAKDLSVSDYFAGYLTKIQNKKAAFSEVAGKLSPDEVAELMTAYANSVFGAHASDIPASATASGRDSVK